MKMAGKVLTPGANDFDDKHNLKFEHRHLFFGEKPQEKVGTSKAKTIENWGFTPNGVQDGKEEPSRSDYVFDKTAFDGETMRKAVKTVKGKYSPHTYNLPLNPFKPKRNCQDAETDVMKSYKKIWHEETLKKGKEWFGK